MFKRLMKEYFSFTKKERLAIIILIIIMVSVYLLPKFISPGESKVSEKEIEEFKTLQQQLANASNLKRNNSNATIGNTNDEEDGYSIVYAPPRANDETDKASNLFYFDPNTLSANGWKKLGLRDKTIGTIQKYLAKGGHFYAPADLKKIYGLRPNECDRIMPYVRIIESGSDIEKRPGFSPNDRAYYTYDRYNVAKGRGREWNDSTHAQKNFYALGAKDGQGIFYTAKTNNKDSSGGIPHSRFSNLIVDINTADAEALIALPGIGSKLAARIINFREKLGGFYAVEQIGETYGLPDSTFQAIKPYLNKGETMVEKIDINKADIETLKQHPYIKWNIANALLRYRDQHGAFKTVEELQQVAAIDANAYKKIIPYLMIGKTVD